MNMNTSKCTLQQSGITVFNDECMKLEIVYFISGWYVSSLKGVVAVDVILILPAAILNLLVACVVIKNKSLQTASNIFLVNLAVSDLITGLVTLPLKIAGTLSVMRCVEICWLYVVAFQIGYYLAMVSFLTLAVVSIDRCIAIFYPFKYHQICMTQYLITKIILVIWICPILTTAIGISAQNMRLQSLLLAVLAPVSIILSTVIQVRTLAEIRKMQKRQERLSIPSESPNSSRGQPVSRGNKKATHVAARVLSATICCYVPYSVLTIIRTLTKDIYAFQGIYDWTKTFLILNSILNPIIYCLGLKYMRRKIILLICPIERINMIANGTVSDESVQNFRVSSQVQPAM